MHGGTVIIIVNFNGWQDTISCLESIFLLSGKKPDIIVVDNRSTDNSWIKFKEWIESNKVDEYKHYFLVENILVNDENTASNKIYFIEANSNRGFSAGNNIGLRFLQESKISPDYVWLLNNDTIVTENSLERLTKTFQSIRSNKKLGILGAKLIYNHNKEYIQCLGGATYDFFFGVTRSLYENRKVDDQTLYNRKHKIDFISGACMLIDYNFIEEVGIMEEMYFLYGEEIDWCWRGKIKGWEIDYDSEVTIYHKVGASTGYNHEKPSNRNLKLDYYYCRNRIFFTRKFFGTFHLFTINIGVIFSILNRVYRREFNRIPIVIKSIVDGNMVNIYDFNKK